MFPLQRHEEEMHPPSDPWMPNSSKYEDVLDDTGIPTVITWSHGGKEIFVEGSGDNWKTVVVELAPISSSLILIPIPSGFYHRRFIIDGDWRYGDEVPWTDADMGNVHNILYLKAFVTEEVGGVAGFEVPRTQKRLKHKNLHSIFQ
ncbi:hypothetical protein B296_00015371 [Ensete ventricosum]|uniref:AMP-activated protein kinase glycogen-binding domain-containing protein n=1 Tax=Ensete ventricosum TaxID=4639 RepID=A0A426ZV24_ENSVE|nr:hypothetical protein B296_00015371 [Ensete ventricosum]